MSVSRYVNLIKEFCALTGSGSADDILSSSYILFNETLFTFIGPHADEDRFHVYCDFGPVFQGKKAETYRQLLEANLLLGHFCSFAINAETRHVILHFHAELAGMTGAVLFANLRMFAAEAQRWRKTQFINAGHLRAHQGHALTRIATTLIKQQETTTGKRKRKAT